jgi:hypothetical protein
MSYILLVTGVSARRAYGTFNTAQEATKWLEDNKVVKKGETGVIFQLISPQEITNLTKINKTNG